MLLVLLLTFYGVHPARATSLAEGWQVVAVRDPNDQLVFCRAEVLDPTTKLTLAVALSPKNEVNIGIKVPDGGFNKGEGFDVTLGLDNDWSKKVQAESAMSELLLIRLGVNNDFLQRFGKAAVLRVVGDADATEFKLKGSGKVVQQLQACVKNAPAETGQKAAAKDAGDFPIGLAALLQAAGLTVQPVPLPDVPGRAVDYAWTTNVGSVAVDGGFREMPNAAGNLQGMVAAQLAPYKKECGAKNIKEQKAEILPTLSLQSVDIACQKEFAAFLFYKTNTNIFAMVIHRGDSAAAKAARDKISVVVRRLGKEDKANKTEGVKQ